MALPKHVTHSGLRSCFPYHNFSSHSPSRWLPLSTTRGYTDQLCGFWYNGDQYLTIAKMKRTNHDLQNTTQKLTIELHGSTTKKRPRWTCVFYKVSSSCSTCGTRRITLTTNIYEIQINIYIYFFIFIFIWISYLDIRCRQNNHGRWAMELGLHHQHDKSGWCLCRKSRKKTKGLSEAVNRMKDNSID